MWTRHHKKKKLGRFILPAITAAFLGYFGYHSLHGDYGLRAMEEFDRQRLERQETLTTLQTKRKQLERQVRLLSDGSMDRDMLDERARYSLNVSKPNEVVIFN
ncbi:septum formation initiator family protein [Rhizobium sp. L1K21]|uniref:FtsB family cell division protein n=1 Tax=Rhizobium sp. L1K21 TaxID=2954933 RepID=UPI002092B548|nr:septum formation initiator family protein [Rhizobium sp. L1K21]MCO6185924.1 septum formation initiator family protein [Rhizobium sp. L1K21]